MITHVCPNPWAPDSVVKFCYLPWMERENRSRNVLLLDLCPVFLKIKADPREVPTLTGQCHWSISVCDCIVHTKMCSLLPGLDQAALCWSSSFSKPPNVELLEFSSPFVQFHQNSLSTHIMVCLAQTVNSWLVEIWEQFLLSVKCQA